MHRALINEFLNAVFCSLHDQILDHVETRPDGPSLIALACTCRAFHDVALDILWSDLSDLTPLVRCLPAEAWTYQSDSTERQVYSIIKPLKRAEWDTLRRHARRIRTLVVVGKNSMQVDTTTICAICHPPTTEPLFPNARELHWNDQRPENFHFIRHFVGCQTKSLMISHEGSKWTVGELAVLSSLPARCPGVTLVHITDSSNTRLFETVSDMLGSWLNLESVVCGAINENALVSLGSLQNLKLLNFELDRRVCRGLAEPLPHAFKSLQFLSLKSAHLVDVTQLMLKLSISPQRISVAVCNRLERDTLEPYFMALQQACQHDDLEAISLLAPNTHSSASAVPAATFVDFSPLTCFANLKSIKIDTRCRIELSGDDLLQLTSAWPNLERLNLNSRYGWRTSMGVTPEHLAQIFRKCKLLGQLSIALDTRGVVTVPMERTGCGFDGLISYLNVLDSTIEPASITPMAALLSDLFPKLQDFTSLRYNAHRERWIAVEQQMRHIAAVREQERRWNSGMHGE